ncbi:transcription-repair coupling factor [Dehalobacter sp. DCM]|uniref:transcription-repair coupling factor n=1 Tax=Dehalobacter sp. DCM TaxID=2907827 RepID=UPI0030818873|nr:transcription-repair coupling factor [Dehalobacter sp. DCM]
MPTINDFLYKGFDIGEINAALSRKETPQMVYNITGSQKAAFAGQLVGSKQQSLIITYTDEQAQNWVNDLETWLPDYDILLFPSTDWLPFEVLSRSHESTAERIRVLSSLMHNNEQSGRGKIVVAPVQAIIKKLLQPNVWSKHCVQLKVGEQYTLSDIMLLFVEAGYERVETIEGKGQFALRGGILDIAPYDRDPIRVEFFDEEVDSIRVFDLETQKSQESIPDVWIVPVHEYVVSKEEQHNLKWEVRAKARKAVGRLQRLERYDAAHKLHKKVEHIIERLDTGILNESIYPYLALLPDEYVPFFEWLNPDCLVFLDEPLRLKEQLDFHYSQRMAEFADNLEKGEEFVNPDKLFIGFEDLLASRQRPLIGLSNLLREITGFKPKRVTNLTARPLAGYAKTSMLVEEIERWQSSGYTIALFAGNAEQAQRLVQGMKDRGITAGLFSLCGNITPGGVSVYPLSISQGFELPVSKLITFTETEIYRRERKQQPKPKKAQKETDIMAFSDLKPGDFVVHFYHGIGKFTGIETITVDNIQKDYFAIKYAGEDKLYVPLDQLQLLQKYLGTDDSSAPKLNKLNGNEWNKAKAKAHSAVKEMAIDLLALYAKREKAVGFAFPEDNQWQREFEQRFPYEETPDQLQSITEVKQDMMKTRPMDRLLCGDVGYGKTEVALRAAFKAVLCGKQVAVMVPTTILAQQHYNTFRERFMDYPVKVDMLSRFRTPKEQKHIIQSLQDGTLDIVVGTHRLLSDGVSFKDLGLLIVDEEQRFGVAHKEKIKTLKTNVDVLTLSATPIPRTLHMSLVGLRDMSIIATPPEDRFPVQTFVAEFNGEMVRDAIRRELNRGGQVFYVHNRVESLDKVVRLLNSLIPEARCGVVHGQMSETQLEREMMSFLDKDKDILVCTTIIETGLDMPNVNTLIVDEADKFGLSQLYQLRGRVGRSNRKAYAYFLYPPQKVLTEEAEKRLSTIREFTEFGSGFKIAMRDLEIRGAGNFIGGEQHGHLAAIGFSLYVKMLKEAVQQLRGEAVEETIEPAIELQVKALLPDEYIVDKQIKATLYQRMLGLSNEEALHDILDELIDRFGTPPEEVENLIKVIQIRIKAKHMRLEQIIQHKQSISVRFATDPGITGAQLMSMASQFPYPLSFAAVENGKLELNIRLRILNTEDIFKAIIKLLTVLEEYVAQQTTTEAAPTTG